MKQCSTEDALPILAKRFAYQDRTRAFLNDFLAMDEQLKVLEPRDVQMIHEDQKTQAHVEKSWSVFKTDYAAAIAESAGKGAAKAKPKGKSKAKPQIAIEASITHAEVAKLFPPTSTHWQQRKKHSWGCPVRDRVRFSEAWGNDQKAALVRCAEKAWQQHLEGLGKGMRECPYMFSSFGAASSSSR